MGGGGSREEYWLGGERWPDEAVAVCTGQYCLFVVVTGIVGCGFPLSCLHFSLSGSLDLYVSLLASIMSSIVNPSSPAACSPVCLISMG